MSTSNVRGKNLFFKHVRKFILKAGLLPPSGNGLVAVSGGADSVVLLLCLHEYLQEGLFNNLAVLHVNHNARPESSQEALWVKELALRLKLPFHYQELSPKFASASNFEHRARKERYSFFKKIAGPDDRIYTGHHLNDSFEWSLMQQLRSSSKHSSLGIPVKHDKLARPLLCVTKDQILHFARKNNYSFLDDPSNQDCRFERNYLRQKIIPYLEKRFPNCLKHYVDRSQFLAKEWGVSAMAPVSRCLTFQDPAGVKGFIKTSDGNEWGPVEEDIRKTIHEFSQKERGVVRLQIEKMLEASLKGKWGPLLFSGGVKGFMFPGMIGLMRAETVKLFEQMDQEWALKLKKMWGLLHEMDKNELKTLSGVSAISTEDFVLSFPYRLQQISTSSSVGAPLKWNDFFPFWVFSPQMAKMNSLLPSLRRVHPLWPKTSQFFIEKGVWFRSGGELWYFLSKKGKKRDHLPLCKEAFIIYF